MAGFTNQVLDEIRDRFAHVSHCPFQGERIFFENAGGALTLKSVVETTAFLAAIPDNQGRDNPASKHLMAVIDKARNDVKCFFNATSGEVFVGESGTELLFRLIMTACLEARPGGNVVSSSLEHPASRSAAQRWAGISKRSHLIVPHDNATGHFTAADYAKIVNAETRVATLIHTSPVTGMGMDVASIVALIRSRSPDCLIIVDGIQHAAHGHIDIDSYYIDGYVISPYKVFSRHGYGFAWISDRLAVLPHNALDGAPLRQWELGTRDTGAYATISDVVDYLDWLGGKFSESSDKRTRLEAAGKAIHDHEKALTDAMLFGIGNHKGLAAMEGLTILGGAHNPAREGLVSLVSERLSSEALCQKLSQRGIRVHTRKADHYSGNVLNPLGLEACVRVSLCHYNSLDEVAAFLTAMEEILAS